MTASKYPSYKDVPIPWIASIPDHWDWKPVLGAASERDEDNKGMKEDNLLSLSHGNIVNKDIDTLDGLLPESFETYQIVRPGDIVLRLTDLQNDKRSLRSALVTQKGIITSAYLALRPESIDPKYLGYLLRAYDVSKVFYSMGGGLRQSMKYGDIKRMPLVIPTEAEQLAIADFLDRETAKIDALIAEQQRLIGLLQEKRQAVISHAVTKGLNPNAPMKDSGVEWLGEVPEHWTTGKLCYYARLDTGSTPDRQRPEYWNGDIPWVKTGEVRYEDICETEEKITELALRETSCSLQQPGTLLMALYGQGVTRGRVGMLTTAASCNQACAAITPSPSIDGRYLELYLTNAYAHLRSLGNETTQQNLNLDFVGKLELLVPPLAEQKCIWQTTKQRTSELDALLLQSADAIVLLQERRSALISAAVTGQIDVRGLVQEVAA